MKSDIDEIAFIQNHPYGQKWRENGNLFKLNTFPVFISRITSTLRELLADNTTHFSRIKQYLHFHRVTVKQYYTIR